GPGTPKFGYRCPQGPIRPRRGPLRFSSRRGMAFVYASAQPPTANTGQVTAEKSSQIEPCFQYGSRVWCSSHGSSQKPCSSSRCSHLSCQPAPLTAGSGGRELKASIVAAQLKFSASKQPPM